MRSLLAVKLLDAFVVLVEIRASGPQLYSGRVKEMGVR